MFLLPKSDYPKVVAQLRQVEINNLFARVVVEQDIMGRVYVDDLQNSKTFYVAHPYGMSLLFGDHSNEEFNGAFYQHALNADGTRNIQEWLQAWPTDWNNMLKDLFGERLIDVVDNQKQKAIELHTRVNFKFNPKLYSALNRELPPNAEMISTNNEIYETMPGTVVPKNFWNNADHFAQNGVGFSLLYNGKLASTAYSAFIIDNYLEIGIETVPEFYGQGFAFHTCAALIDYSVAHNLEPIWACRLNNVGSLKLAHKLGFEVSKRIPYYCLPI